MKQLATQCTHRQSSKALSSTHKTLFFFFFFCLFDFVLNFFLNRRRPFFVFVLFFHTEAERKKKFPVLWLWNFRVELFHSFRRKQTNTQGYKKKKPRTFWASLEKENDQLVAKARMMDVLSLLFLGRTIGAQLPRLLSTHFWGFPTKRAMLFLRLHCVVNAFRLVCLFLSPFSFNSPRRAQSLECVCLCLLCKYAADVIFSLFSLIYSGWWCFNDWAPPRDGCPYGYSLEG